MGNVGSARGWIVQDTSTSIKTVYTCSLYMLSLLLLPLYNTCYQVWHVLWKNVPISGKYYWTEEVRHHAYSYILPPQPNIIYTRFVPLILHLPLFWSVLFNLHYFYFSIMIYHFFIILSVHFNYLFISFIQFIISLRLLPKSILFKKHIFFTLLLIEWDRGSISHLIWSIDIWLKIKKIN